MRVFKVEKVKKDLAKALSGTCSKEKGRAFISKIYYDAGEKKLVSTNGRTMLIVDSSRFIPIDDEENGSFELIGDNLIEVSMNEKFPDWKRVIPSDGVINNRYTINPDVKKFKAKTMAGMICLLTGYIFNLDDKEVMAGMELYSNFQSIGWNGNAVSAIKINGAGFMYIFMPMAACLEKTFTKEEIQEKEAI